MRLFLFTFLLCFSLLSPASVDMKNASFSDYWVDLMVPGNNFFLRIARTYNSRSLFSGIFGFGWCSNLETQIEITLEGNLLLSDCGSSPLAYYPASYNTKLINESVHKIIELVAKKQPAKGKKYLDNLREQLRSNHLLRTQLAGEVGYKIPATKSSIYLANGKEIDRITFDGTHYIHAFPDGTLQHFDSRGKLVQLSDKNKGFIKIAYANNLPHQMSDNAGNKLTFQYTPEKKIKKILGVNGLVAAYKFSGENLVGVTNAWKNSYTYAYDNSHNLTKITFPDGTFKSISYIEMKDWVKDFKDRDGCVEAYDFVLSTDNPRNHYSSTAEKKCNGKLQFKSRYEFWYQLRPDKEKYLSRVLSDKNSQLLDVSYHQDFGKPISIRNNSDITTLQYLENGLIKQKTLSLFNALDDKDQRHNIGFQYSPDHYIDETLSEHFTKSGILTRKRKTLYKYDLTGRLVSARASDGQYVEIRYNTNGLIVGINDHAKKEILIDYDEKTQKPVSITRPSVGSIKLSYSPTGAIKKVSNKGGSTVNTQIYAAFNNFIDLLGPVSSELRLNL